MAVINKITYNVPDTMTTSHVCTGWGRRMPMILPVILFDTMITNHVCTIWGRRMPMSLPVILRGIYLTDSSNAQEEILSQTSRIAELSKAKQYWS